MTLRHLPAARQYADCAARCARHGWVLRQCSEGYELLGNGARATFGTIGACAVWLEKQSKAKDTEEIIECVQMTFLDQAA